MKTSKNGLHLCEKAVPSEANVPGGTIPSETIPSEIRAKTNLYLFPSGKPIDRPPMDLRAKVFVAIMGLLLALYTGVVVTDMVEGREPPVLDSVGAPRPCAPPSYGLSPDCHLPGQK